MISIEKRNWVRRNVWRVFFWALLEGPQGVLAADVDVCIIGAGPSGVQAAVSAEAAGLKVALFEKDGFIGGKTKAVEVNSLVFPIGAVTDVRADANSIEALLQKFDTAVILEAIDRRNVHDGTITPLPGQDLWSILSGLRFLWIRIWIGFTLDSPEGYLKQSGRSGEYWQPARDWLAKKGLASGLTETIWFYTCLGYGQVSETPIIYYLKAFSPRLILYNIWGAITSPSRSESKGTRVILYQELFKSLVGTLKGQIFLSANITDANYSEEETTLTFNIAQSNDVGSAPQQLTCGSTIIAFAPVLGAIDLFAPPTISKELQSLASKIQTVNYYSVILADKENFFDATGLYNTLIRDDVPDNPAEILMYLKVYEGAGTPVLAYYFSPSTKTEEQARKEILISYSQHVGASTVLDDNVILVLEPWLNYFPHAPTDALEEGFYKDFDDFQGVARQYYVGGLFMFETVQYSMEHARFVVEKHLIG